MKQSWLEVHFETIVQNVLGLLIAFIVMKSFGISTETTVMVQVTMFVLSYIRSYCVRYYFNRKLGR
jgi:uncharacterized membrane protein YGL010W